MNTSNKHYTMLAAMAMCAMSFGQLHTVPNPVLMPPGTKMTRVEPIYIQPVMKVGSQVFHTGPRVKYIDNQLFPRVGNLIYDAFEGNSVTNGNPDVPTDGLYGEAWFTGTNAGERYYFGPDFADPYSFTHYLNVFPGQANKPAVGLDLTFFVALPDGSGTQSPTSLEFIDVFTANDAFNQNTPPSSFNAGVELTYTPIPPGNSGYYYSNVDLTTNSLSVTMPTNSNGWYCEALLNTTFTNTITPATECINAQPMFWGTKPLNPSVVDQYTWLDGSGSQTDNSQTGTPQTLFTFEYDQYATVTAYTVDLGHELSTHNISNLSNTPGQDVVVSQRAAPTLGSNNAQVTATVQLASGTNVSTLVCLRALVVAKANAIPVNTAVMNMYMLNNVTHHYDLVRTLPDINAGADGTLIMAATVGQYGLVDTTPIANYVNTTNNPPTVNVRFGVQQLRPAIVGWNLTMNYASVQYGTLQGPSPLQNCAAFSTPN